MDLAKLAWSGSRLLLAAGVLLHLGGIAWPWMPSIWTLLVLLIAISVIDWGSHKSQNNNETRRWQECLNLLRLNSFETTLLLLVMAGTVVRVLSIDSDLGQAPTNIDERRLAESILEFFQTGEIPHETVEHYPGIFFWMLAGSYLFTYLWALLTDAARNLREVPLETFVLAGRLTNVVLASGIIIFTGLIGRALRGSAAGLLAAAVMAFVPLSVTISSLLRNEAPQLLFIIAAVWAAIEISQTRSYRFALIAGGLAGIATAIKYSSVFVLLAVLVASIVPTRNRLSLTSFSILGFGAALAITNHFLWADIPNFLHQLSTEVAMTGQGHWSATDNPARFYLSVLSDLGPGAPLLAMAAGFVAYTCASGGLIRWIVLVFPLTYMLFMTQQPAQFSRWVYPLTPFVAVAGLSTLTATTNWLLFHCSGFKRPQRIACQAACIVLIGGILWAPAYTGATIASRRSAPTTYDEVRTWLRQHTTVGDRVLAEEFWLNLSDLDLQVHRVSKLSESLADNENSLWSHDWVVVPEPYLDHPGLEKLRLAQTFVADYNFGGNTGFDFSVYASPYRVLGTGYRDPIKIHFRERSSASFLGPEWTRDDSSGGLLIPSSGASVFVPPSERSEINISLTFISEALDAQTIPLWTEIDGHRIPLVEVLNNTSNIRIVSGTIHLVPTGVMELRIGTSENNLVRIIELNID